MGKGGEGAKYALVVDEEEDAEDEKDGPGDADEDALEGCKVGVGLEDASLEGGGLMDNLLCIGFGSLAVRAQTAASVDGGVGVGAVRHGRDGTVAVVGVAEKASGRVVIAHLGRWMSD